MTEQRSRLGLPSYVTLALPIAAFAPVSMFVMGVAFAGASAGDAFHTALMFFLGLSLSLAAILLLIGKLSHARKVVYLPAYAIVTGVTLAAMSLL